MEGFVSRHTRRDEVIVCAERGDKAEIGVRGAALEAQRESEHVDLVLQGRRVERRRIVIERLLADGLTAQLPDGPDKRVAMAFMVALESDPELDDFRLQKPAGRRDLKIGRAYV